MFWFCLRCFFDRSILSKHFFSFFNALQSIEHLFYEMDLSEICPHFGVRLTESGCPFHVSLGYEKECNMLYSLFAIKHPFKELCLFAVSVHVIFDKDYLSSVQFAIYALIHNLYYIVSLEQQSCGGHFLNLFLYIYLTLVNTYETFIRSHTHTHTSQKAAPSDEYLCWWLLCHRLDTFNDRLSSSTLGECMRVYAHVKA